MKYRYGIARVGRRAMRLKFMAVLALTLVSLWGLVGIHRFYAEQQQAELRQQLEQLAYTTTQAVHSQLTLLNELSLLVQRNPDIDQATFARQAKSLLSRYPVMRALELARANIISHVYPLSVNAAIVGYDLLHDPFTQAEVKRAIEQRTAMLAGPHPLKQGGTGIIYRAPIFVGEAAAKTYWGLGILVMDWEMLAREAGLLDAPPTVDIALRQQTADGGWSAAFYGDDALFDEPTLLRELALPQARWQLAVRSRQPGSWTSPQILLPLFGLLATALLAYYLLNGQRHRDWFGPAVLAAVFMLLGASIIWLNHHNALAERQLILRDDAETVRNGIQARLQGNLHYLQLLGRARATGELTPELFRRRAARYVQDHPELINVTWVGDDLVVHDVAPRANNQQILGLPIALPEPSRAANLARELGQAVYTRPFEAIQGELAFEVWTPVFRDEAFLGLFVGVYSAARLLETAVPDMLHQRYSVNLVTADQLVIGERQPWQAGLNHAVALHPPGYDVRLRLSERQAGWSLQDLILSMITLSLALGIFYGMYALQRANGQLARRARHDALTGLHNRFEFEQQCREAIADVRQGGGPHVMLYMDLDQFKIVNDTCGHMAGDALLKQLSGLLEASLREDDILARLGGDEFGVLLRDCSLVEAERIADELRRTVQAFHFVWQGKVFTVGSSIGLVGLTADTEGYSWALSAADMACYMAKEGGRNRIHVYTAEDQEASRRQGEMHWVSHLHQALAEHRFCCYYQPIQPVPAVAEAPLHYEVLLRLRDEQGELVSPGAFLPAAERYDLMPLIDRWVVSHTLRFLEGHPRHCQRLALCNINLSGQSIGNEEFLAFLLKELERSKVPRHKLCFEITETVAVANMVKARHFISQLRQLGVRFALDDFGSGMASFSYLKHLPVDFLKIDGSIVKDIATNTVDCAMVKAINEIGHAMGIKTIAEFVEDDDVLQVLRALGVDYAQGYGIARPLPLVESEGHAAAGRPVGDTAISFHIQ